MKEIPLTQGKVALVDDEDFDRVSQFKWFAVKWKKGKGYYAARNSPMISGKRKHLFLHRFVLGVSEKVDHRNRDGLDCQKHNLRLATDSQNNANRGKFEGCSSKYKGVHWCSHSNSWRVGTRFQGKHVRIGGCFKSEEAAARAYDAHAKKSFGEFARLNFPE